MNQKEEDTKEVGMACSAHELVVGNVERLETLAIKLSEGLQEVQLSVVKLTENIETAKRLNDRVDKLEKFMWKSVGAVGALSIVIPVLLKFF